MIRAIEVQFALPVELTDKEMQILCDMVQTIALRHRPPGMVHWQSGVGSKQHFSQADARFLGKAVDPNAPLTGEPSFDDDVLYIETSAREAYASEVGGKP